MLRSIFLTTFLLGAYCIACCQSMGITFHDEASDTLKINELLMSAKGLHGEELVANLSRKFLEKPYIAGTLEENNEESLTVNLDEFDCTTLVETVMALALTVEEGRDSWRDFVYTLRKIRYRGGVTNGYASRLHYISDWIVDNTHRGNFKEVTQNSPLASYEVKTLDFMSSHRNLYEAMASGDVYEAIKNVEVGYRSHRFPVIKSEKVGRAMKDFLKEGDIVAIVSRTKGLDVAHMGIVTMKNGVAHLLHASSKGGKVMVDEMPLDRYLTRNRHVGIRVIRL